MADATEDSVAHVFRLWLKLSQEEEIRRLLELIPEEFARRGCSLSYQLELQPAPASRP
jgi:hypothetical protein